MEITKRKLPKFCSPYVPEYFPFISFLPLLYTIANHFKSQPVLQFIVRYLSCLVQYMDPAGSVRYASSFPTRCTLIFR